MDIQKEIIYLNYIFISFLITQSNYMKGTCTVYGSCLQAQESYTPNLNKQTIVFFKTFNWVFHVLMMLI